MSDTELRHLQRFLSQNPEDYAAWRQYLQVGARVGAYDPNNWNDSATWITGVVPPIGGPNFDYQQAQIWNTAEDRVTSLLHQIRNSHQQLSAIQLAVIINRFFSEVYSKERKVEVAAAEEYGQFPVVVINDTYRILYDERVHYIENRENISRTRFTTTTRSILDITPQYLIETDIYYPGSQWSPPDSDQIIIGVARNLSELLTKLINIMENEENQEIYYDAREESDMYFDTNSDVYIQGTFQYLKLCLDGLFQKYKIGQYESQFDFLDFLDNFTLSLAADSMFFQVNRKKSGRGREEPFNVVITWAANNVVPRRVIPTKTCQQPWQVVEYAWRSWLAAKTDEVLLRIL